MSIHKNFSNGVLMAPSGTRMGPPVMPLVLIIIKEIVKKTTTKQQQISQPKATNMQFHFDDAALFAGTTVVLARLAAS